ncbi:hypothetical protein B0T24DRAFT_588967 [Lasiosphaeria ovina]|uniref:Uncharacterized protein n=1 Tax=Lasiosphaeria ovina TaxID=92902 RepID=A0AAE0TYQ4_9PEZI|nr:hypothetical protein B0T24DRAFT_588967 [Lasiosphaeria ovina]
MPARPGGFSGLLVLLLLLIPARESGVSRVKATRLPPICGASWTLPTPAHLKEPPGRFSVYISNSIPFVLYVWCIKTHALGAGTKGRARGLRAQSGGGLSLSSLRPRPGTGRDQGPRLDASFVVRCQTKRQFGSSTRALRRDGRRNLDSMEPNAM